MVFAEVAPTKPTKPGFDGFVGSFLGEAPEICPSGVQSSQSDFRCVPCRKVAAPLKHSRPLHSAYYNIISATERSRFPCPR